MKFVYLSNVVFDAPITWRSFQSRWWQISQRITN